MTPLPTVAESREAKRLGQLIGPDVLLKRAVLRVLCTDCGQHVLIVALVGGRPLVAAHDVGDRLAPDKHAIKHWNFTWLDRGSVQHARCAGRRHIFEAARLLAVMPRPGGRRVDLRVSHVT